MKIWSGGTILGRRRGQGRYWDVFRIDYQRSLAFFGENGGPKVPFWKSQEVSFLKWFVVCYEWCLVASVCPHGVKIQQHRTQIPTESSQNHWKSDLGSTWDHFGSQVCRQGRSSERQVHPQGNLNRFLSVKGCLEILETENGINNIQWMLDRHQGRLTTSESVDL